MFDFIVFIGSIILNCWFHCRLPAVFAKTPPLQEDCDQSVTARILYKMCIKLSTLFMILLTSKWTVIYCFEFIPPAEEDLSSYMDVSIQSVHCQFSRVSWRVYRGWCRGWRRPGWCPPAPTTRTVRWAAICVLKWGILNSYGVTPQWMVEKWKANFHLKSSITEELPQKWP